jgi:hypothetical protein
MLVAGLQISLKPHLQHCPHCFNSLIMFFFLKESLVWTEEEARKCAESVSSLLATTKNLTQQETKLTL